MTNRHSALPLDKRLLLLASLVPQCEIAADIGADHGKLSAFLLLCGKCQRMIVSDISEKSRKKVKALFARYGLGGRVTLSGEDGLKALMEPVDAVIIAGMGGKLIAHMLSQKIDLQGAKLILSPQSEQYLVRDAVVARAYRITQEHVIRAKGRYYQVIEAIPGKQILSERERYFGHNINMEDRVLVFEYFSWQFRIAENWKGIKGKKHRLLLKEIMNDCISKN